MTQEQILANYGKPLYRKRMTSSGIYFDRYVSHGIRYGSNPLVRIVTNGFEPDSPYFMTLEFPDSLLTETCEVAVGEILHPAMTL